NTTYEWSGEDQANSIVKSPAGGYAIAGWTNTSGKGDLDSLLLRIAPDGTHLWNRTFGAEEEDKGFQVINCNSCGFALTSIFMNTSAPVTNSDFLITRLANDGSVFWNKSYSGPNQDDISQWVGDKGYSIAECSNNDFIVAGVTAGIVDDSDVWLMRISSTGVRLWQHTYHQRYIDRCFAPHSVVQCQDGGFAVLGYTYNSSHTNQVWLIRTNPAGIELWNQTYGDNTGYQRPEGLVECSDGGFGIIANTHTFGAGDADGWLIRTDASGNQLWNQTFGGTEADGTDFLMEMLDGGFTVSGSTNSFDVGNGDAWLIRVDENGTILWNFTIGDTNGNSATSFVYEGGDTYTVVGNTLRFGEVLSDIWVFKVKIITTIITNTPPTETGSYPGIFFSAGIIAILYITVKIKKKKYWLALI
ncbi:MAG: hypothetical protein ACTSSH_03530, partial [Candidatus Heimdallarchaeota archaeon]